jgi:thiol-disulfide isomerase/thioredoxin
MGPQGRIGSLVIAGIAFVIACGPATPDVSRGPTCTADGAQANLDFTLRDLEGQQVRLSHFKGRVLFLNFWATWCGPCRIEIPALIDLQRRYGPAGLEVVGIVVRDDFAYARPYAEKAGINYPVLDGTGRDDLEQTYRPPVLPSSFLVARDGSMCSTHWGIPRPAPGETIDEGVRRGLAAAIKPLL